MRIKLESKEKRALTIAVVISLVFAAYFLRHYFSLIVVAAIMSYVFYPMRMRIKKKVKRDGMATSLTLLGSFLVIFIPFLIIVLLTVLQIESLLHSVPQIHASDIGQFGHNIVDFINNLLAQFPGGKTIDMATFTTWLENFAKSASQAVLNFIVNSVGGIPKFFTDIIIFIFVFASLLNNGEKIVQMVKDINPLGDDMTNLYFQKMGDMTKAVIRGQFVIAFCQGLIGAASLYIVGWHSLFFFMLLILTVLSIIPLGSGILTIPIGIVMILLGDYWQGAFVIFTHVVVVTNVDNFLRPRLVPKSARLNPALMILAVFSGIGMFGFLGIIIGPVIMVVILSTIQVYLSILEKDKKAVEA